MDAFASGMLLQSSMGARLSSAQADERDSRIPASQATKDAHARRGQFRCHPGIVHAGRSGADLRGPTNRDLRQPSEVSPLTFEESP